MAEPKDVIGVWAIVSVFGGSLLGALVGALANFGLQSRALSTAKQQRDDDRFEKRKASGFSLFVKMIRMASDLRTLFNGANESLEDARSKGFSGNPYEVILPQLPLPRNVDFTAEELALVLSLDISLFNEIAAMDQIHGSTIALFDLYAIKRAVVMEKFNPVSMQGNMGTLRLTEDEHNWLAPRAIELSMLADAMIQRSRDDAAEVWSALEKLHAVLEKEFKTKLKLEHKYNKAA